ncbi:MAG: hypothetical protein ACKVP2_08450 [Burkholderiales bacterium]
MTQENFSLITSVAHVGVEFGPPHRPNMFNQTADPAGDQVGAAVQSPEERRGEGRGRVNFVRTGEWMSHPRVFARLRLDEKIFRVPGISNGV